MEESIKRLGDSTEGEAGGKRIRLDNEGCSTINEENEPETKIKEKDEEIEKLRQQLALKIESEETVKANYDDLISQLAAKVECPVCFEVPKSAPIHSCANGHLVCRDCRRDTCPTCRVPLGRSTSLLAVTVIEQIPHRCEFESQGCSARLALPHLKAHISNCPHRLVRCPNFSCPEKVSLAMLAEHTLKRCIHNGTFYGAPLSNKYNFITYSADSKNQFDRRRNSTWRPDGLIFDGKNFFLKITRKGRKGSWFFYVQMASSEQESSLYTTTIHVFNPKAGINGRNSYRFIGEVCPVDVSSTEKAAEDGFCQVVTDAQMRKLFTGGSPIRDGNVDSEKTRYEFSVMVDLSKAETLSEPASSLSSTEDPGKREEQAASDSDDGFESTFPKQWPLLSRPPTMPSTIRPSPISRLYANYKSQLSRTGYGQSRHGERGAVYERRWGRIAVAPRDSTEEENEEEDGAHVITQRGLNSSEEED